MKTVDVKDSWDSGDHYEYFMGRWSRLVARSFIDRLSPSDGLKWLDVGCGSGALSEAIINNCNPSELNTVDQSEGFVKTAQKRLGNKAICRIGNALALPIDDSSVDFSVSGLVLNFISEPEKAIAEMKRVTVPNGCVAVYVWDYAGKLEFLTNFWNAAVNLDPKALPMHEANRFPNSNPTFLKELFVSAGLTSIVTDSIEIDTYFRDFDDYWQPFLGGQGPAPSYVSSLDESKKNELRDALYNSLPIKSDGSIVMSARAWAIKGIN